MDDMENQKLEANQSKLRKNHEERKKKGSIFAGFIHVSMTP